MKNQNEFIPKYPEKEARQEQLKKEKLIAFDTNLSDEEKKALSDLSIEAFLPEFDYYGKVDADLVRSIAPYLQNAGKNSQHTIQTISKLIGNIALTALNDLHKDSAWVMIRTSLPHRHYDTPRWHQDGNFFTPTNSSERSFKLAFSAKGGQTRFAEIIDREMFQKLSDELNKLNQAENYSVESELAIRQAIEATVKEIKPIQQGYAAYFLVGGDDAQVHSEPPITEPRIFISVVAGTETQINELQARSS